MSMSNGYEFDGGSDGTGSGKEDEINLYYKLVKEELIRALPHLTPDFIEQHQDQLMDMLSVRSRKAKDTDPIPGLMPDAGTSLVPVSRSLPVDDQQKQMLAILDHYREEILNGKDDAQTITGMCLMFTRRSKNMEMVFSIPCNIFTYLGLMHASVGKMG